MTPVHAVVSSRVDYCNSPFASAPNRVTDKLQSVLNAAARLITVTQKYERGLSRLMNNDLAGWLFHRGCSTTSPWRFIVVFSTGLQDISPTTVCLCPFPVASIYELSDVVSKLICSTCSPQHVWEPWLFFSRRTNSLELTVRWFMRSSCWLRIFLASVENTSIRQTSRSVSAMCFTLSPFTNRHLLTCIYLQTQTETWLQYVVS